MSCLCLVWTARVEAVSSQSARGQFVDPPRQYSTGPLWVWNDMLTDEEIVSTLQDLAQQKVKQAFVHPRPGLMTPYLSKEWFRLWNVALEEAERLDMNIWIYDENSYPSGFAGGLVPDAIPATRGRGLHIQEVKKPGKTDEEVIRVFLWDEEGCKDFTKQARSGEALPEARYLVASVKRAPNAPWFGDKCYVDLLYPPTTIKFLKITLDAYREHFGKQFGKRIPGSFTDEPNVRPAGGLPWTEDLPQAFQRRWGYSLLDNLPSLVQPIGDWKKVRHNYFQLLLELFINRWARPYSEYCEENDLEFTGHYWEHEWPRCIGVTDNMAMYAWHQRPAIDCLMNRYGEDVHAQFGNVRAVRELSSVANQLGRTRTLCEAYGAGGWDLRLEDMKRIGDWLYVLGVNTLDEHLSYITIRGARKRDHPQSFSYHTPWWPYYHIMAEYFTRLSLVLSQGEQINRILVLEPTTTAWIYQEGKSQMEKLDEIGSQFQKTVYDLDQAQLEYDIGCENIIAHHGSVKDAKFIIGQRKYDVVVLPPLTENLNAKTITLLEAFLKEGGSVLCAGEPPSLIEGKTSPRGTQAATNSHWKKLTPAELIPALQQAADKSFTIQRAQNDKGILFHHRRQLKDGEFLFLVNTSIDHPSTGNIFSAARGIEQWHIQNADITPYVFTTNDNGVQAQFELPPCGSLLLFLSKEVLEPAPSATEVTTTIAPDVEIWARRLQPNVLTLDYVDITAAGQTKKNIYFYQAGHLAFVQNGMARNPWDSAVQFKDELIKKTFPPDSGFEATYRFKIKDKVPSSLLVVIERPDLYKITCNGKPVTAVEGQWWLDKAFGKIDISSAAQVGENAITINASPFTIYHELESAYILGDFSLRADESGFVIQPDQVMNAKQAWNQQGMPFYSAGVSYAQTFVVDKPIGSYYVCLPSWCGSVAHVKVNGHDAGNIAYQPWQLEVTDLIRPGQNLIEVTVIGTLRNTLGPHHAGELQGAAWPNMFHKAPETGPPPGIKYSTLSYGIFEPFVLKNSKP